MQNKFDLDKVNMDPERAQLLRSIDSSLAKVYRGRKSKAHAYFKEIGGPADIQAALNNPPNGMSHENWAKAVEHFQTPEFLRRSASNKECRAKQVVVNRGGSSSYNNACFKEVSYDIFKYLFKV